MTVSRKRRKGKPKRYYGLGVVKPEEYQQVNYTDEAGYFEGNVPIEAIEGIGVEKGKELRAKGIRTVVQYDNYLQKDLKKWLEEQDLAVLKNQKELKAKMSKEKPESFEFIFWLHTSQTDRYEESLEEVIRKKEQQS